MTGTTVLRPAPFRRHLEWLEAGISMYPEGQNENIDIEWIAEEKRRYGPVSYTHLADNQSVHNIIKLLEQVAQDNRS